MSRSSPCAASATCCRSAPDNETAPAAAAIRHAALSFGLAGNVASLPHLLPDFLAHGLPHRNAERAPIFGRG